MCVCVCAPYDCLGMWFSVAGSKKVLECQSGKYGWSGGFSEEFIVKSGTGKFVSGCLSVLCWLVCVSACLSEGLSFSPLLSL